MTLRQRCSASDASATSRRLAWWATAWAGRWRGSVRRACQFMQRWATTADRIAQYLGERPKVPVMLHFGEQDQHIPQSEIDAIAKAHPEVQIYTLSRRTWVQPRWQCRAIAHPVRCGHATDTRSFCVNICADAPSHRNFLRLTPLH